MVSTGHVIKFVAKVAIPIVEVDVKNKLGQCDGPDYCHAIAEQGTPAYFRRS
jgi:hypothetical protein